MTQSNARINDGRDLHFKIMDHCFEGTKLALTLFIGATTFWLTLTGVVGVILVTAETSTEIRIIARAAASVVYAFAILHALYTFRTCKKAMSEYVKRATLIANDPEERARMARALNYLLGLGRFLTTIAIVLFIVLFVLVNAFWITAP